MKNNIKEGIITAKIWTGQFLAPLLLDRRNGVIRIIMIKIRSSSHDIVQQPFTLIFYP